MSNSTDITLWLSYNKEQLTAAINELINADFGALLTLLYRLDVDEQKVKDTLALHPDANACLLLAELILERQAQKEKTKQQFKQQQSIDEKDKW